MPAPAVPFPLPVPCPIDGRTVVYSGRGKRPIVCSPACRVEYRRRAEVSRRAARRAEAERRADEEARAAALAHRHHIEDLAAAVSPEFAELLKRKRALDAALMASELRLAARESERNAMRLDALAESLATFDDFADTLAPGEELPAVELTSRLDGSLRFNDAHATARDRDPAARWLAENHPEELATFPLA